VRQCQAAIYLPVSASSGQCRVRRKGIRRQTRELVSKIRLEASEKKNSMASKHKNGAEPGWSGFGNPTLMKIFFSWARE
jgi:hypothetical protein